MLSVFGCMPGLGYHCWYCIAKYRKLKSVQKSGARLRHLTAPSSDSPEIAFAVANKSPGWTQEEGHLRRPNFI